MDEVRRSVELCPLPLPSRGCRHQMSEKRPVTRQGFYSRVFSGDYRREGRRMIVGELPYSSEEYDLQKRPQRKISSLMIS
jgi:hypothetical protein